MALPYSASMPAVAPERTELCRWAGSRLMRLVEDDIRPRDILTRQAFENAIAVVVAIGGSTNARAAPAGHRPRVRHRDHAR